MEILLLKCPHCDSLIEILKSELNCCIFRHGYFYREENGQKIMTTQMNPHESKENCERFFRQNKILGCGKPFQIDRETLEIKSCDYI